MLSVFQPLYHYVWVKVGYRAATKDYFHREINCWSFFLYRFVLNIRNNKKGPAQFPKAKMAILLKRNDIQIIMIQNRKKLMIEMKCIVS